MASHYIASASQSKAFNIHDVIGIIYAYIVISMVLNSPFSHLTND